MEITTSRNAYDALTGTRAAVTSGHGVGCLGGRELRFQGELRPQADRLALTRAVTAPGSALPIAGTVGSPMPVPVTGVRFVKPRPGSRNLERTG